MISEVQTEITGEGSMPSEDTIRGLESMRSMDSVRSTASTRRRRKKNKKRKSLTEMFGEGPAPEIKEEGNTVENKKEQIEEVLVSEIAGEVQGEKPAEEQKEEQKEEPKQKEKESVVIEAEDGPTVEVELKKQSDVEVSLDMGPGSQAMVNVDVSHPETAPEEIHTMGNVLVSEPVEEASKSQAEKPKSRLRGLMSRAIKIKPRSNVGSQSSETSPTELTPTAGSSRTTPPSPTTSDTKLSRPSRKYNVPGLARISDELSQLMNADKKIKGPNALPYSQSMPSLVPTQSPSRVPVPGGSRRESMDYPSSGQESPIEPQTEAVSASGRTTRIPLFSQLPRLSRTMTEPAMPMGELPMKHYPASTDDISNYEGRVPLRPSQTIRLVDPDPEDVAAKPQRSPSLHRFGFRRTPSQSSLTGSSFRDSVDDTRPASATPGGVGITSGSTPTLGHSSDSSPSGSTINLGLFRAKTWGFDKDKRKEKKEEKKAEKEEKKAEKEREKERGKEKDKEKKDKDKDGKKVRVHEIDFIIIL